VALSDSKRELTPLYRRLPHAPHGMDRDAVARHQRARLYGAMVEAVHRQGYRATTVAHVIALAGVSRRAFYEQFANKEQCFLSTYDICVARVRKRMMDAWMAQRGWINRTHAALETLLDEEGGERKGTHLVLVDSLELGDRGRERMQLADAAFGRLLNSAFPGSPMEGGFHRLTSRAIVGGVRHAMFKRLLKGHHVKLMPVEEVLDWIESYRTPGVDLWTFGEDEMPRIAPKPAAFLAGKDERSRLLASAVHLTLDEGYTSLTDPMIAAFAEVATGDFHRQFANREECFLTILDEFTQEAVATVKPHLANAETWSEGVHRGMGAFVEYLVAHPGLLQLAFVDLFQVGPPAVERMARPIEDLTTLLTRVGPAPQRAPDMALDAVTGAVWNIISTYASRRRAPRLQALTDPLTFYVLAPYVGPKDAIETIRASRRHIRAA
jgi:AcrR family transcriptional regulator